ncbi:ABC transporter ATP-binding protein [Kyrpidia spormannii]|uniref:ABC transporter ATP-binding protein n=1 Tax=Kyrpidia spormannii TaxID=2055160 RepID=A0A2K8NBW0_9BACL|nr:ABC transporter ATP-binding protein [Kyrpidia spormannii]
MAHHPSDSGIRLKVEHIKKYFGTFPAVDDVSFEVRHGEVMAIIGPNGAGKTTVFNVLSGHMKPTSGHIYLDNVDIAGQKPHKVARLGIGRAFQTTNIFPSLTVLENVLSAVHTANRHTYRVWGLSERSVRKEAEQLLSLVNLTEHHGFPAGALSHGDQRALEIALALATSPKVLLLDEPTAGMSPYETQQTVELVRRIVAAQGLTVVLSEHDMEVVFGLADRITVMEAGRVLARGTPQEIRENPAVQRAYLGE